MGYLKMHHSHGSRRRRIASLSDTEVKDQARGMAVAAGLLAVVAIGVVLIIRSFFR